MLESASITALLTSCPHLRELRLAKCPRIGDGAFLSIPSKSPAFETLRILDLTDCFELGDKAVEKIVSSCPRLRNLILAKCRQLTDRAVWAITKLGKNLHYIHLGHCARITDASIVALAKACNRIRYIDLACCSNLSDTSITQLANLPKLKRVGLVKCAGITDRSIQALATYGGRIGMGRPKDRSHGVSVLERVHLSYCTQLTLDGIHTLLNNCPRLTHLSLTGVQSFLRDDLTVFCREAPSEFNDHQREVFCVFSGNGVARLREYLNGGGTNTPLETGIVDSDDDDDDDDGDAPAPPPHSHAQHPGAWAHGDQEGIEDEDMEDDETPGDGNDGNDGLHGPLGGLVDLDVDPMSNNDDGQGMATASGLGLSHAAFLQRQQQQQQQHNPAARQAWGGTGGADWAAGPSWSREGSPRVMVQAPGQGVPTVLREAQALHVTGMMGAVNMVDGDEPR